MVDPERESGRRRCIRHLSGARAAGDRRHRERASGCVRHRRGPRDRGAGRSRDARGAQRPVVQAALVRGRSTGALG